MFSDGDERLHKERVAMNVMSTILACTFFCFATKVAHSQCDSLLQVATSDSGYVVVSSADTNTQISADEFGPEFHFGYVSDSSHSQWRFKEFLLNKHKLYLMNWCHKRLTNWDAINDSPQEDWDPAELRARSTTRVFPVEGGDTLQFYRTLSWVDRLTGNLSYNRYVNPNGLAYSVELVDTNGLTRIMLLDTFNIGPTTGSKKPCIYSWYPSAARIRQVVPVSADSTDAIIRINTWANGAGPAPFYRHDKYGRMMSYYDLTHSYWRDYMDSVEANIDCSSSPSCDISAIGTSGPSGVSVSAIWPSSLSSVEIRDVYGTLIWSSILPFGSNPTFVPCSSGLRIVIGSSLGQAVCTKKVYVP